METKIKNFQIPVGIVNVSNVLINIKKCTFSLTLAFKPKGTRKKPQLETIEGTITPELLQWLTRMHEEKVKVIIDEKEVLKPTGKYLTGFQKFLIKKEIEFKPGILNEMTFTCDNKEEDYYLNPFKIIKTNDKNILSLITVPAKERVFSFDHESGKERVTYKRKTYVDENGNTQFQRMSKKSYVRLIVQEDISVPLAQTQN